MGIHRQATFIIDPAGKIARASSPSLAEKHDDVVLALAELQGLSHALAQGEVEGDPKTK